MILMSLFQCSNCGCVENTALAPYPLLSIDKIIDNIEELSRIRAELDLKNDEPFGNYCSECHPLGDKKWHGEFERIYLPKGEFETSPKGDLWHKKTHDRNFKKYRIK